MRQLALALAFALASLLLVSCASAVPASEHAAVTTTAEIGSLRNAVIATPPGLAGGPLTYLARGLEPEERAELAALAPELRVLEGLTVEQALARANEIHGADSFYASPEFVAAATNLRWVQIQSAGVERYVYEPHLGGDTRLVLTNLRAVSGPAIADHVFAMLLALTRDLPVHLAGRSSGRWDRAGSGELEPIALADRTCLVVGLGGIGSEVARRAHGFGMRVLATRRSAAARPAYVDEVGAPDRLLEFLAQSDVVVLCVPLTNETEGMIDAEALAAMPRGGYLVNIARGRVVDTAALVEALASGQLAGACLDVTEPEPLPPGHALWSFHNVVITPHVAARAELTSQRRSAMYVENLRRFALGEPLYNVVDREAGY